MNETIFNAEHLIFAVKIIAISYMAVILAMLIDLIFGIRKAKIRKEARTSEGLKRTTEKATKYFAPMVCLTIVDSLLNLVNLTALPYLTLGWAVFLIVCESWSVLESTWDKKDIREKAKEVKIVLDGKDDLSQAITNLIDQKLSTMGEDANQNTKDKP